MTDGEKFNTSLSSIHTAAGNDFIQLMKLENMNNIDRATLRYITLR